MAHENISFCIAQSIGMDDDSDLRLWLASLLRGSDIDTRDYRVFGHRLAIEASSF
jgi:hypothetical protein